WQARKAGNAVDVSHGLHLANACRLGSASIGARPGSITNEVAEVAVWLTAVTRLACDGEGDLHAPSNPLGVRNETKRGICPPVGESNI
ncbi:hypothetical protein BO83DRAFT_317043, partial [Aspergillus eucalypticola CBS 122712]